MCIRLGGIFLSIVYDVIVTSSTIPFSTNQCCEIPIFSQTSCVPYKLSKATKIAGIVILLLIMRLDIYIYVCMSVQPLTPLLQQIFALQCNKMLSLFTGASIL